MKVDMMEFSIHSSQPEIHDRITGITGSWKKAVENMDFMMKKGVYITPVIVITSLNYQYAEDTVNFFHQMGIKSIMVNRYNIGGEGLNHPDLSANAAQLRETFGKLDKYAEKHPVNLFSGVCTPFCLLNPDDYPHIRFGSCSADVYHRPLTFDLDGHLRLCNHSPVKVGNIYNQSLTDIFANPYVSEWENMDIAFCKNCTCLPDCKGGCRAASEQIGHSLQKEDPIINELNVSPILKRV
jgi:radical SAM protein with 4Fe4S-binding SPASM domain